MATDRKIWSDYAVLPGDILKETLEALEMSQAELAARMDRPKQAITEETAIQLERVLGVPAHAWINLERDFRLTEGSAELQKEIRHKPKLSQSSSGGK